MYQILTGKNFERAVKAIPLKSAVCGYTSSIKDYCVWEISDEDYKILDSYYDEYDYFEEGQNPKIWKPEWSWWRWCSGSNINGDSVHDFIVKGNKVKLYYSDYALLDYIKESLEDFKSENGVVSKELKEKLTKEATEEFFARKYVDFLDYCISQYGASTAKNVCAISVESAKLNKITMAEFWKLTV